MSTSGVYKGFWINWSEGKYLGATLTLPATEGLILVAFLALFVQASGGFFWRVICFTLHQLRSTTGNKDGLHHHQQALLRNAASSSNALWDISKTCWAWRSDSRNPFIRSLPLVLISLVHIVGFGIAGLFSSRVVTTANEVLVRSDICGWPKEVPNPITTPQDSYSDAQLDTLNSEAVLGRWSFTRAASYVRNCYNEQSGTYSTFCNVFVRPRIESTVDRNAACPFASDLCEAPAVSFDSGYIDSNRDLGINAEPGDSIQMRRVTTCAPLLIEDKFATPWVEAQPGTDDVGLPGALYRYYNFGEALTPPIYENATFAINNYTKALQSNPYVLFWFNSYPQNLSASDFLPSTSLLPPITPTSPDTTLLALLNSAYYVGNVTDPFYHSTNSTSLPLIKAATRNVAFLGCSQRFQYCNNLRCTEPAGLYGVDGGADNGLKLNERQTAVFRLLNKVAWSMSLQITITLLGVDVMLARDALWGATWWSSPLPSTQWVEEAFNLHNISLAVLQRRVVEFASPPDIAIRPGLSSLTEISEEREPGLQELCQRQKIRAAEFTSFNVFGLAIILFGGAFLILLDVGVVRVARLLAPKMFIHKEEWDAQSLLQLQRLAFEARGIGPWKGTDTDVPVLVGGVRTFSSRGSGSEGAWASGREGVKDMRTGTDMDMDMIPGMGSGMHTYAGTATDTHAAQHSFDHRRSHNETEKALFVRYNSVGNTTLSSDVPLLEARDSAPGTPRTGAGRAL